MEKNNLFKKKIYSNNILMNNQAQNEIYKKIQTIKKLYLDKNSKWRGGNTKGFRDFNLKLLKSGETDVIAFSNNKVYNRNTNRLININKIYKQDGKIRAKYDKDNFVIKNQSFLDINSYLQPLSTKISKAEQDNIKLDVDIDFKMMNYNMSKFLNILRPTTRKYVLKTGNNFYTLSASVLEDLTEQITSGELVLESEEGDSKTDIIKGWYDREDWLLTILPSSPKKKAIIFQFIFSIIFLTWFPIAESNYPNRWG